jgi:hypothetical protein
MEIRQARILALQFLSSYYEAEWDMLQGEKELTDFMTKPAALEDFGFIFDCLPGYLGRKWQDSYYEHMRVIHNEVLRAIGKKP